MESTLVCDNRTDNIEVAKQHYADTRRDYLSVGFDESAELGYIWRINVERFLRGFIDRTDVSTQELMRELNARAFYDFTVTEPLITPSIRWYARTLERSYGVKLDELPPEICESEHLPDERCESGKHCEPGTSRAPSRDVSPGCNLAPAPGASVAVRWTAGLETRDTAGLEACATGLLGHK